jgi:septum formation protein
MHKDKIKFVLASASPRRKELLGHLQIPFEIIVKSIVEESHFIDPVNFSRHIAQMKGAGVYEDYNKLHPHENVLVISADTVVNLEEKIFGKPANVDEARKILSELSGRTHSVFTAVAFNFFFKGNFSQHAFVEETRVTFNPITDDLMERYLSTGDSSDKAGAYGIQGPSLTFISKVEGDYANVVGFPLSRFVIECKNFLKPLTADGQKWFDLFC